MKQDTHLNLQHEGNGEQDRLLTRFDAYSLNMQKNRWNAITGHFHLRFIEEIKKIAKEFPKGYLLKGNYFELWVDGRTTDYTLKLLVPAKVFPKYLS